jgi:hypothetical protein
MLRRCRRRISLQVWVRCTRPMRQLYTIQTTCCVVVCSALPAIDGAFARVVTGAVVRVVTAAAGACVVPATQAWRGGEGADALARARWVSLCCRFPQRCEGCSTASLLLRCREVVMKVRDLLLSAGLIAPGPSAKTGVPVLRKPPHATDEGAVEGRAAASVDSGHSAGAGGPAGHSSLSRAAVLSDGLTTPVSVVEPVDEETLAQDMREKVRGRSVWL